MLSSADLALTAQKRRAIFIQNVDREEALFTIALSQLPVYNDFQQV
jgi:hypothetical protein